MSTGAALETLMRQALAGDKVAYAEVLRASTHLLRPFLLRRLGSDSEVDDVLQEILLSLHKARHTYDGARPFQPWLFAIARFRLQDHLRVHYADRLRQAVDIDALEDFWPADVTEPAFGYESIKEEMRHLPEKQAAILTLIHRDGYTAREVAGKLGMGESAVKVAAHRAYKALRKRLEQ